MGEISFRFILLNRTCRILYIDLDIQRETRNSMEINPDNRPLLFQYFEDTADVLLAEYNRSAQQKAPSNLGKNKEMFCKEFLSKVLPAKLSVKSGEIWDSSKQKTGQQDVILLRDDAPALHIGYSDVYLAGGVFLQAVCIKECCYESKYQDASTTYWCE